MREKQNLVVVVICAMEFEMAHLRQSLDGLDWPVELVVSGWGMARAASTTRQVIERLAPSAVINYGCAGAHREDLSIGDVVVGTHAVAYLEADCPIVECDPELIEVAKHVADDRVVFGTVASADAWNRAPEAIAELAAKHLSLCEDMEAAAIGLVCKEYGVPFLTIKDISNNELLRPTLSAAAMIAELGRDQIGKQAGALTFALLSQAYAISRR